MGSFLCKDCNYSEPNWITGKNDYVEAPHCYGRNDWAGPKGLIGGGNWCICSCVGKRQCQKCQGKCSYPPFTRQVCNFCQGTGKYQPRPEDIAADEAEKRLLEYFVRVGKDFLRCKACQALTDVVGSQGHLEWHFYENSR